MDNSVEDKTTAMVSQEAVSESAALESGVKGKDNTPRDQADMWRMGKTQELRRDFSTLSMFGFTMILVTSWEAGLEMVTMGLTDGGTAGLIWMSFICWISMCFVYLSLAEMASMAPTSGGWFSVLGWQSFTAGAPFIVATMIQGLVVLNYPEYVYEAWHGTCLTIAVAILALLFNIFLARKLPLLEGCLVVIHILGFFATLVTLWVLSPTGEPKTVFTKFGDSGGWGNLGGAALIGITSAINPVLGADAAVHMSEEVKDAGRSVPRAMMTSAVLNGALSWAMTITFCFCISAMDLDAVLNTETGYPFIQLYYNVTQSKGAATGLACIVIVFVFAANITTFATSSRQLYAFARDDALPFSPWLARVHEGVDIPLNALVVTFTCSCLLSFINIGSSTALNSILSLSSSALITVYMFCIGCMIWRRWTKQPLLPAEFSLGKFGLAINIFSFVMLFAFCVLSFFPTYNHPTPENMNWNALLYGAVFLTSVVYFFTYGRKHYMGPVTYVRKLE